MKASTGKAFRLPHTAACLSHKRPADGKIVAHSLDFDIVAVADSEEQAFNRLRLAIKTYVEYGISNGWTDDILFSAPQECWESFQACGANGEIRTMEPIRVDDDRMIVVRATITDHERSTVACQA